MDINQKLTEELGVKRWQIDAAVNLIDEGNYDPVYLPVQEGSDRVRSTTSSSGSCMSACSICATWKKRRSRSYLKHRGAGKAHRRA